jgi:ribonuclease III
LFFKFFNRKSKKLSREELEIKKFIIKSFGYRPKETSYFLEALTHKSFQQTKDFKPSIPNERLEFLGDAILDSIVAEYLFLKYPDYEEGSLTQIKSKIVNRSSLSEIGDTLKIRDFLRYNKSRSINVQGLEGNCLEAIVGAIYLDGGYNAVKKSIISHVFRQHLNLNKLIEEKIDFKSRLFIWCQKKHISLDFEVTKEECTNGVWNYEILAVVNAIGYGRGVGTSKKQAEQMASKETLMLVGEL